MDRTFEYYVFDRPPFSPGKQNGAVIATPPLERVGRQLASEITAGAARVCVRGPLGVGKTSLARALPKLLADQVRVARIADPSRPWSELPPQIESQLGLEGGLSDRSLAAARAAGPALLLVIDRAETITPQNLAHLDVLLNLRFEHENPLLQSVLFEDSGVWGTPLEQWATPRRIRRIQLAPLEVSELATYIWRRLVLAGWKGGLLFSSGAVSAIHHLTEGVPGAVEALCERVLVACDRRHKDQICSDLVESVYLSTLDPDPDPEAEPEPEPACRLALASPSSTPKKMASGRHAPPRRPRVVRPQGSPASDVEVSVEVAGSRGEAAER